MSAESPHITVTRTCPKGTNAILSGEYYIGDKTAILTCQSCGARCIFTAYDEYGQVTDPLSGTGTVVGICKATDEQMHSNR